MDELNELVDQLKMIPHLCFDNGLVIRSILFSFGGSDFSDVNVCCLLRFFF